jgi:hypothetical protein
MGAGRNAVRTANELIDVVGSTGRELGLDVAYSVPSGETVWATKRRIKVVLSKGKGPFRKSLGVECFCQDGPGTANQKAFAKIEDIKHWPIPGVLVFAGPGLSAGFCGVLVSLGAIPLKDLEERVRTHFNL